VKENHSSELLLSVQNEIENIQLQAGLETIMASGHKNKTISRKGANIISRRPSHGHLARRCCPQAFLRIFSEVTYIRTVGNSTLLKIYTLPNHTITIGVCIIWWWR
jgi:hypothetical protein